MGLSTDEFYDEQSVAIVPMGFCYPGRRGGGDAPPRAECVHLWRDQLLRLLPAVRLTLLVGSYAQQHVLGPGAITPRVRNFRDYLPDHFPLPHPSWRSRMREEKNPWFAEDVLPALRSAIERVRAGDQERIFSETGIDARAFPPAGCEIWPMRAPQAVLRFRQSRFAELRVENWAPSDPPGRPGVSMGGPPHKEAGFSAGLLDGLVERCLFWPHLLILRHGRVTPSGSCLHEQEDGPDLVSPQMKDKRILLGDAGEYLEVNRPSTTGMEFCRGSESRRFRNHFFDLNM